MKKPPLSIYALIAACLLPAGCESTQLTEAVSTDVSAPEQVQVGNAPVDTHPIQDGALKFTGPFPDHDYPFPVKDSGVEVRIDGDTAVEWLDEERVIFSALAPGEPRMQGTFGARKQSPGRVVVWNTLTEKVTDLGEGQLWCSHSGAFTIWYKGKDSMSWLKKGSLNNFHVTRGWREGDPIKHQDMHTCQIYDGPPKTVAPADHVVFELREQDGFLDTGSRKQALMDRKDPVVLIRPDGARKDLPLLPIEMDGVWWEEWAGVYILDQFTANGLHIPPKPDRVPLLHPDGTLQWIPIPARYSRRNEAATIALTRRGLLVGSTRAAIEHNPGESGLYLIRGDNWVRLADWYIGNTETLFKGLRNRGIAISPSGCKVAFKHGKGVLTKYRSPYTIQMIDVCKGK
ncbi:hypothetical protein KQ940_01820 [Marinobacterium sp. D7]|uniref:hypothetical protein n=1 Tax=Marinobacterium ramblicola TaxID=2849041 RepID=UPI001C2DACDF|nr:hypothetical protein [Marinobacterium ramblicola]MBV1786783.1 hypothetical protein [Marinobacterium ramblicola]